MACFTNSFMLSNWTGVGSRLSSPITYSRIVVAPTYEAILQLIPLFSIDCMYSPSVFQLTLNLKMGCSCCISFFMFALSGPILSPSPNTSRVTPSRNSPCDLPSSIRETGDQLSILIKPGDTALPFASTSDLADSPERSPMKAIVSFLIPISALNGLPPFPSYTIPFRIIVSYFFTLQANNEVMMITNSNFLRIRIGIISF